MELFDKIARRGFLKLSTLGIGALGIAGAAAVTTKKAEAMSMPQIDVACDATSIRFEGPQGHNPDNPGGDPGPHPYYGASFVVQGVIYTSGTLRTPGSESSGLLGDGTPEFPGSVIGKWTCRGWFVGDSNDPENGGIFTPDGQPFVATTQIYDISPPSNPATRIVTSEGLELNGLNFPFNRVITGGTGTFKNSSGQVVQTGIGVNATGLFNFTFDFDLA